MIWKCKGFVQHFFTACMQPVIFYDALVFLFYSWQGLVQSQERLRARGCYKQCSLSVLFLPSLSNRKYAGPRPPSGLIREGRREHGGADKTLIGISLRHKNIHSFKVEYSFKVFSDVTGVCVCMGVWCMKLQPLISLLIRVANEPRNTNTDSARVCRTINYLSQYKMTSLDPYQIVIGIRELEYWPIRF